MMQHLIIFPILVPMVGGLLMLLPPFIGIEKYQIRRVASVLLVIAQLIISIFLLSSVLDDGPVMYAVGDWQPPFGIILYADLLSSIMVCLTSFLGVGIVIYSLSGTDRDGKYFHPLVHFQLLGICGAFLTNDLFNLFVFFEVLLIASYSLLLHGGGKQRTEANVHYVILNLIGSSIFLIALGTLYGTTGTLNIADMAMKIKYLSATDLVIAQVGGTMLLVVFGLKSAMLPLHFWLPKTYAAASAPIAALFAIMTKVGVYCIFRVYTVVFGDDAGELANMVTPIIWPAAIFTCVAGTVGVLASPNLRTLSGNLVIVSVGTLLLAFAIGTQKATAAALVYMLHSTLVSAALFLIADMIGQQRGKALDWFVISRKLQQQTLLGSFFFIGAMAIAGLPPFSGFLGKLVILQSVESPDHKIWIWGIILLSSLATIIALSRAGTTVFWRHAPTRENSDESSLSKWQVFGALFLLIGSPFLVIFGAQAIEIANAAAQQLADINALAEVMNLKDGG